VISGAAGGSLGSCLDILYRRETDAANMRMILFGNRGRG
jgi:hypothetical protein